MRQQYKYSSLFIIILLTLSITAQSQQDDDETEDIDLPYPFEEKDPYSYDLPDNDTGLYLRQPSNYESSVEYDPENNEYIVKEKIGEEEYAPPRTYSVEEYKDLRFERSKRDFWHKKARGDAGSGRSFIPSFEIGGKAFNAIFGSNTVDITPQGAAELIFSINTNRTDNPALQEKLRSTTTFDFQENIQMNVQGKIGDKVSIGITYDTEATFDFENKTNIGYTGDEDEIIQKIEAGNVSLPLTGSLITGSQNLFGIKTELKFGHLTMTSVFSQQKGKTKTIEVEGGGERREFEVRADDYEENKHFFLSQYFAEFYDHHLSTLPLIQSGINISKIEVWVTNTNNQYGESRDIAAFMDLGETGDGEKYIYNTDHIYTNSGVSEKIPYNTANNLYNKISNQIDTTNIVESLNNLNIGLENGIDFESIEQARKLRDNEFTLNSQLGFISLNFALQPDQVLAVAFEFTFNGNVYQVGEFSRDKGKGALILKLIKGTTLTPRFPTWELMMKNVYSIGAYQVEREDFMLNIKYRNNEAGTELNYIPEGNPDVKEKDLLYVLNLDRLNTQGDKGRDGYFDFVPGVTILPSNGRVIFPIKEPFGSYLEQQFNAQTEQDLIDKYVFNELYDSTKTQAQQIASKNKYIISGTYKSSSGSEIPLNAMNVPKGSVKVTAGGIQLQENVDYTVDYTLGRVKILNTGLLESGTPIQISLESNALYNMQTKTLIGTHLDYEVSENFMLGGTILNLTERPLTKKVNIGDEPISNTIWGINGRYSTEAPILTKLVDKLPFIETKETSTVSVEGEFAHLIPGHSKAIEDEGNAYIDDFEGSESSIDLKAQSTWVLASVPQHQDGANGFFPEASKINDSTYGFNRAKLAWYVIDPLFLRNNSYTPDHIKENPETQSSHFVREIYEKEIFPKREAPSGVPTNIAVLNLAYYPRERGPYNYDVQPTSVSDGMDENGNLNNPQERWGGVMREIPTTDFEAANVEFIDFWLMDPFAEDSTTFGINDRPYDPQNPPAIYFNLGDISEDILRDSRKMFENGLPDFEEQDGIITNAWGRVPDSKEIRDISSSFDNDIEARLYQDVGFDGYNDDYERDYFNKYLAAIADTFSASSKAYRQAIADPSADNFSYYRSSDFDQNEAPILYRYKNYNGPDGNSPASEQSTESYTTAGKTIPDIEDINNDNTLSENEGYYQYKVELHPDKLVVGENYIMDKISYTATFENDEKSTVNWYHFRIPIREYDKRMGSISDFNSIRFFRMYLRGFRDSVFLRFATLDLVRGEWRKYNLPFISAGEDISIPEPIDAQFEVGAVNIEENANKTPVNYILPPGIDRVIDPASPQLRQLNEQSMMLKVKRLEEGDARAAYKNVYLDMREYEKMEMFVHAEEIDECPVDDYEMTCFIRMGTDYTENYYEYEVPLKLTPAGTYSDNSEEDRYRVWPEENNFEIDLDKLVELKLARNREMDKSGSNVNYNTIYSNYEGKNKLSIRGNPTLSEITTIMVGVRNPRDASGTGQEICGEVWVNELRLSHFREQGGWAANARVSSQLADFANVSVAGMTSKPGFGSIEKKTSERSKEDVYQYDISSNVRLGKFFPEKAGVRIPMFIGYSKTIINPQYNPLDEDVLFKDALNNLSSDEKRDTLKSIAQDLTMRKSINFQNIGISTNTSKPKLWDPSNISLSYSYRETFKSNVNLHHDLLKEHRAGLSYNFTTRPKPVQPFRKSFRKPYLRLIRDFNFNYYPSMIGFNTEFTRRYNERSLRNIQYPHRLLDTTYQKDMLWTRNYTLKYDLTRSIKIDFTATARARIDEPYEGNPDSYSEQERDKINDNINEFGRPLQYNHQVNARYITPINKIPLLNWTSLSFDYNANYVWNAGPVMNDPFIDSDSEFNSIGNSSTLRGNLNLSMRNLYNKVGILKKVNNKYGRRGRPPQQKKKKVTYEDDGIDLKEDKSTRIRHNLNTEEIQVWVTTAGGEEIEVDLEKVNKNVIKITPERSYNNTSIKVEGEAVEKTPLLVQLGEYTLKLLMSTRTLTISYSSTDGTDIPGFEPKHNILGMDDGSNWAPGLSYVFGFNKPSSFIEEAYTNQWLSSNDLVSSPVLITHKENLNLRGNIEPINGLRIDLTGNWTYSETENQYWYPIDYNQDYYQIKDEILTTRKGNYSISTITWATSWEQLETDDNYYSPSYEKFQEYRATISERLYQEKNQGQHTGYAYNAPDSLYINYPGYSPGFGPTSSQVMIPAFLAAYTGRDPENITLDPMPDYFSILPNWRIRYNNLTKLDFFEEYFQTFNINHAYSSTYNVGAFTTNPDYDHDSIIYNLDGNIISEYDIGSVTLQESYRPLLGVDMTFKNNLTARIQWRRSRTLTLSFANNRMTEVKLTEWVFGLGYRFEELSLIIGRRGGGQNEMEGDLTLNGDVSIKDNKTILRDIDGTLPGEASSGKEIITIGFSADYALSSKFNLRIFYDRIVNNPLISRSFPTRNTNIGISVRFTLTQ